GGLGGSGNIGDKVATAGGEGEKLEVEAEFRIMADVFLVGLPSSGKSSLLHRLTRAQVEGKDYPFATRTPVIGAYLYDDYKQILICELPSLYSGSVEGRGLGTAFLKHLVRARLMVFLVDTSLKYAPSVREGLRSLQQIVYEHDPALRQVPSIVVVNKIDIGGDLGKLQEEMQATGQLYFLISVRTGEGVESLMDFIRQKIESDEHA
ncbi:MAG: 50S ribosome-binding GTPase, partial [Candidatus Omnitrophica bacterium]|nr:50S ribosome-binding GTPase [Candidatus Omnitrophota bacterium]